MKLVNFEEIPFKEQHAIGAMSEKEISETDLDKSVEDNFEECNFLKPRASIRRIVDDSSDEECSNNIEEPQNPKMQTSEEEKNIIEAPQKKKKIKKIFGDSDSEEELLSKHDSNIGRDKSTCIEDPNETCPFTSKGSKSPKMQSLSPSDQDEKIITEEPKKKKKIKKPLLDDSDSEEEQQSTCDTNRDGNKQTMVEDNDKPYSYKSMFQNTDLYDAEGSSDEDSHRPHPSHQKNENKCEQENITLSGKPDTKGSKKQSTSHRKSKQSALEEIHSETQRLIRHSRVSLPYHQPKQRSLSEFLSRRKVVPIVPLKTSSEQLSEVWQSIEEREKSAEQFYKSESDCSEEESIPPLIHFINNENPSTMCDNSENSLTEPIKKNDLTTNDIDTTAQEEQHSCEDSGNTVTSTKNVELPSICVEGSSTDSSSKENNKELISTKVFPESNAAQTVIENSCNLNSENLIKIPVENSEDFNLILLSEKENFDSNGGCELTGLNSDLLGCTLKKNVDNSNKLEMKKKLSLLNNSLLDVKLDVTPKISGNPEELIDFEKVADKPAALQLVSRFLKHVSLKPKIKKQEEKISIAITEVNTKGEVINLSEEILSIKSTDKTKPGETRFQLKAKLKQKIAQSREEQFVKRLEEYKLNEELYEGEKEVCSDLDDHDEEIELSESSDTETEPEENDVDLRDKCKNKDNPFLDEEAEESENEDDDDEVEPECDTYSDPPSIDVAPLIDDKDFSDSLKADQDATVSANYTSTSDLMALCSGVFPSQDVSFKDLEKSENTDSQTEGFNLCIREDATIDIYGDERKLNEKGGDESSDEEVFTKKTKKKVRLEFSDDEDDENSKISISSAKSNKALDEDEEEEIPNDEFIDDETVDVQDEEEEAVLEEEEEEIIHDPSKAAKRFLEDEAELSGSEYGSADEDEVDLDNYEEEQGDQDKINQKQLRTELGKIHMKEILDEDKREIRILQELLLEDGELHSDGPRRQRQFKWYNQDETDADRGIYMKSFDDEEDECDGTKEVPEAEEDESWRKTRLERENFLQELQKTDDDFELIQHLKKFNKSEKKPLKPAPKVSNMPSPNPKKQFSLISKRGSFLGRGEKVLSKLAEMTNVSSENPLGNSRGKKNMVFAVVSPPKEEEPQEQAKKRKSTASLPGVTKKLKFSPGNLNVSSRKSIFENLD